MLNSRHAAGILASLMMLQAVPAAYASPAGVGRITVREAPPPSPEDVALAKVQSKTPEPNMGKINIADDIILDILRKKKPDTKEIARIKTQLAAAIEASNSKNYNKVLNIMEHLHAEHPESRTILKWLGIYQNWAGLYEESRDTFENLLATYPLNPEEAGKDFMLAYYTIDNERHLQEIVPTEKLDALKALAEKQEDFSLGELGYKQATEFLADYQRFMVETKHGATLTPTDSKALDDLWKRIPKAKRAHLDNYYGYNIDELTPVYARFYHRKDLTEAYEGRQQKQQQYLIDATIKEPVQEESPVDSQGQSSVPETHAEK